MIDYSGTEERVRRDAGVSLVVPKIDALLARRFDADLQGIRYIIKDYERVVLFGGALVVPQYDVLSRLTDRVRDEYQRAVMAGSQLVYFDIAPWEHTVELFSKLLAHEERELKIRIVTASHRD